TVDIALYADRLCDGAVERKMGKRPALHVVCLRGRAISDNYVPADQNYGVLWHLRYYLRRRSDPCRLGVADPHANISKLLPIDSVLTNLGGDDRLRQFLANLF